jgi:DNA mismatch repair protein MutS
LKDIGKELDACEQLTLHIRSTLTEEAPAQISKGNVIASGVNNDLDELRGLLSSGKDHLIKIQQREIESTGISSLKIGFNNVFGYYLEVTNAHKNKVPAEWTRKQTLTGSERYITEELKDYESKILGAEEKIQVLEQKLYLELLTFINGYISHIQRNAQGLAKLDCLLSFAQNAKQRHYCRPHFLENQGISVLEGRHPVIEDQLPEGEKYVPNDLYLDQDKQQIIMITGPNMAGKSAYLRQNALITLMAHLGSFVPAKGCELGITDKIFTRVGASDNISKGESTFMVEMNETASILNNLSERSLVILDEIGRGTSTYDGISIAWAISEYLHQSKLRPKTLFATHYHELNEMTHAFERIKNYNIAIKEVGKQVLFIRKLIPGGSEHSFGIHVAKMAGMPSKVVSKASKILKDLERTHRTEKPNGKQLAAQAQSELQLSFFQLDDPTLSQIREEILKTDINTLTPVEALMKLNEIKGLLEG